jgi:GT2 family glycosyltransferase
VSEPASLDIIIVSYDVRDELDGCLRVLEEDGRPGPGTTVTVVDNASSDGTAGMVRQRWPAVRVIEAGANVGFARANNLGIRSTTADFVLLLNPDTRVNRGAIATLMTALGSAPEAAAVGPRLVDDAGRAELSFGPPLGPLGEVRQKVTGRLYDRGSGWVARWVERRTREAGPRDWLTAACLLLRRRDVEAVGLMDETFFMYTEDVDLCVRLRQRGRQLLFVPAAEVVHLRGRSSGRNPATERLRRRSQLAYYAKHHPRWLPWLRVYLRLTGRPVE